ncbi:MAG TPA: VWA domain-containing protein [Candidatus Nanoarchaeia archaeon]|nr:VWA domain-containing protein [Candidatus Nanoarchaeia archaeon]
MLKIFFYFAEPKFLILLLVIPLLIFIHFFSINNRKKIALKFANFEAIGRIEGVDFFSKNITDLVLSILIVSLLIFTISGLTLQTINQASAFSFVIAIDNSQSMSATDLPPNRLAASQETASHFVESTLFGTRIGLISFAGTSYIEEDLTIDRGLISKKIKEIKLNEYGGTDLHEAVLTASNMLKNEKNKALILLSDGQINVGNLNETIDYANRENMLIHTIGIGTIEGGETIYGLSKLDEDALKALSYNTWGSYFEAENQDTLEQSFRNILGLTVRKVSIDISGYLVSFAIILFVIKFFLMQTKYINFF